MFALTLSLAACFGWGAADFLGGLKSRRLPTLTVLVTTNLFGTAVMAAIVLARGKWPPAEAALWWAPLAGAVAVAAMLLLYRALAVGTMAIVAPISASGVIIPVLFGLASGERLTVYQAAGVVAAMIGVVLASRERAAARATARGVGLALGSSAAIGIYFVLIDRATAVEPYWAAMYGRLAYGALLVPIVLRYRPPLRFSLSHLPGLAGSGVLDSLANIFFVVALSAGMLSLVSVVASLYPAVTVVLSMTFLKERPQPVQIAGVVLALVGVAMISAG